MRESNVNAEQTCPDCVEGVVEDVFSRRCRWRGGHRASEELVGLSREQLEQRTNRHFRVASSGVKMGELLSVRHGVRRVSVRGCAWSGERGNGV
jgi:hypothetical protein